MIDLTPITRIEKFLDAIVNGTTPPEPIYRVEFYLAQIAGADVTIPEPIFRIEKYLAKLCGEDVEIPEPIYRIEFWLAKKCGMDVETPTPIFRIEFWLDEWTGGTTPTYETLTGKIISFIAQRVDAIKSLIVGIEPQQDLHGYDAPWPPGGGKNLAYLTYGNKVPSTGSGQMDDSNGWSSDFISVDNSKSYVVSVNQAYNRYILFYDSGKNYLGYVSAWDQSGYVLNNYANWNSSAFVKLRVDSQQTETFNIQLELGSSATTFAPYSNECPISGWTGANIYDEAEFDETAQPKVTVQFGQTIYGCTAEDNGDGTWTVTATHKGHTFNGSERWDLWNGVFVNYDLTDMVQSNTESLTNKVIFADRFKSNGVTYRASCGDGNIIKVVGANTQIACYSSVYANETAFKASLVNDPMMVVYELATPLTFTVTAEHLTALVGNNTVWASTNGDITATVQIN